MNRLYACSLAVLIALVGCGPDEKKSNNGDVDDRDAAGSGDRDAGIGDSGSREDGAGGEDAETADGGVTDGGAGTDASYEPGDCGADALLDQTVAIDEGPRAGQFYARAAWDTTGAWVVYNRRAVEDGPEEIFAARVGCKGEIEIGPLQLSQSDGNRRYMPTIDTHDGITHVAWAVEQSNGQPQYVQLMMLNRDGEKLLTAPADITPLDGDTRVEGLAWEPDIAVLPDGSGAVVVSAGGFGGMQAWVQRYDEDGATVGSGFAIHPEEGVEQKRPSITAADDGTLFLSYIRYRAADGAAGTPEEPEMAVVTTVPAGANAASVTPPLPAKPLTTPNQIVRYAKEPGPNGELFLAFDVTTTSRADILVRDGSSLDDVTTGTTGSSGYVNSRPSVAGGSRVGALAWYRYNETPLRNDVMVQSFRREAGAFVFGEPVHIPTDSPGIPPFGPDVTPTGGNVYFVVWGEGASAPDARIYGRFVGLP